MKDLSNVNFSLTSSEIKALNKYRKENGAGTYTITLKHKNGVVSVQVHPKDYPEMAEDITDYESW